MKSDLGLTVGEMACEKPYEEKGETEVHKFVNEAVMLNFIEGALDIEHD